MRPAAEITGNSRFVSCEHTWPLDPLAALWRADFGGGTASICRPQRTKHSSRSLMDLPKCDGT